MNSLLDLGKETTNASTLAGWLHLWDDLRVPFGSFESIVHCEFPFHFPVVRSDAGLVGGQLSGMTLGIALTLLALAPIPSYKADFSSLDSWLLSSPTRKDVLREPDLDTFALGTG